MRRMWGALAAAAVMAVLGGSCSDDGATPEAGGASDAARAGGVDGAAAYLASTLDGIETPDVALIAYLQRNWSIDELAAAPRTAEALFADQGDDANVQVVLFRRLADPAQGPPTEQQLAEFELPAEDTLGAPLATILRSLTCDVDPLGRGDAEMFGRVAAKGGYDATHAGMALRFAEDLRCPWASRDAVRQAVVDRLTEELGGFAERGEAGVEDLSLEMGSVLHLLGADGSVPDGWAELVLRTQNPDGGWSAGPEDDVSDWHATLHALWFLLQEDGPGRGAPIVRGPSAVTG